MNIEIIKEVVNDPILPDEAKSDKILQIIAKDKNAIPTVMQLLAAERQFKDALISDMNLELSRADVHIQDPMLASKDKAAREHIQLVQASEYVLNHITAFYVKYKGAITHCFNKQL